MTEPASTRLPAIPEPGQLRPIHPAIRKVWLLSSCTSSLGILAVLVPFALLLQSQMKRVPFHLVWVAVGLVVLLLVRSVLFVDRQFKAWGYLLTDNELVVRYGVWWRVAKYIPRESIQHVDINQGPVDRWNRLAQVVVHTAGVGAVVTIPGLTLAEAQQLRDRMMPTEPVAE